MLRPRRAPHPSAPIFHLLSQSVRQLLARHRCRRNRLFGRSLLLPHKPELEFIENQLRRRCCYRRRHVVLTQQRATHTRCYRSATARQNTSSSRSSAQARAKHVRVCCLRCAAHRAAAAAAAAAGPGAASRAVGGDGAHVSRAEVRVLIRQSRRGVQDAGHACLSHLRPN